jgi:hypothetical protein
MVMDVIRALGRRWYVLVAGLILTAGLAYGAYAITPPQYAARGLVLLLPSDSSVGKGGNPFLALGGLDQPAGIVVAYFTSSTAQDAIAKEAPNAEFEVAIDDSTRGPVIAVSVTDKTPDETIRALQYITDQIPIELERLQQQVDAPADAIITSMPLVIDERAKKDNGATIRMVIAAAVVGVVITGVVAFALDGLLMRRLARKKAAEEGPIVSKPTAVDASPEAAITDLNPVSARVRRGT